MRLRRRRRRRSMRARWGGVRTALAVLSEVMVDFKESGKALDPDAIMREASSRMDPLRALDALLSLNQMEEGLRIWLRGRRWRICFRDLMVCVNE